MIRYYGEYESASRFYIPIGHCLSLVNKQHRKQVFKITIAKQVIRKSSFTCTANIDTI